MNVHETSIVHTTKIGNNTFIWQFCVILEGAIVGDDCNVCSHCFIENDVKIGSRVTIKNHVSLYDSVTLEDDVFIGPNVTFTNDVYPRSNRQAVKEKPDYLRTIIGQGASIGGGAVILPGIKIGKNAMIGAGAIVTRDVPENTLIRGDASKNKRILR